MTQDFAKIRPEPLLERKPVEAPPAWSLMFTGMVVGLAIGVLACFLFYLSGNVPPLNLNSSVQSVQSAAGGLRADEIPPEEGEEGIQFEFYQELQDYEVSVDATPVELTEEKPEQLLDGSYMLQTGAFEQQASAIASMQRQQALGLEVIVKRQTVVGRLLYLVQSGPYQTSGEINTAEQVLRSNNIPSTPIALR